MPYNATIEITKQVKKGKNMQMTTNVPDNAPMHIVQQYIQTIESQLSLITEWTKNSHSKKTSFEDVLNIAKEFKQLPILDNRSFDEILGYSFPETDINAAI